MNLKKTHLFFVAVSFLFPYSILAQSNTQSQSSDENVIAQMNYCITTLTNILNNKSMVVLEHESDQIVNNLTMKQIVGLDEIKDFRIELLDAISKFEITEEERALMRRIQSIKKDNLKWNALSNALNPTMLLTGKAGPGMIYQMAFQVLLTAARSVVEYKSMSGEQNIEELRAMWDLRKEDLRTINEVRKSAQDIIFNLYNKYDLDEDDRLTEATANLFSNYISEIDAAKRIRLLEDNYDTYKKVAAYYYYLGMAYIDLGQYAKAKPQFDIYLNMYQTAPILRCDEKSGCIALTVLLYEKHLLNSEKENLINIAIKNLPGNSAAVLQCVMVYLYELQQEEKGLQLLRSGIDDPKASDRDLLFMAAANLFEIIEKYDDVSTSIKSLFAQNTQMNICSYVTYLLNSQTEYIWEELVDIISFSKVTYKKWYKLWIGSSFNDALHIIFPERFSCNNEEFNLYFEEHSKDKVLIKQMNINYANGILAKKVEKVNCFKANKNLKYLFLEVLIPNKVFTVKSNLNYEKIRNSDWPRMSEFILSEDDIDDIIKFCKKYTPKENKTILECENIDSKYVELDSLNGAEVTFLGDTLKYQPHHSVKQIGHYLRMVFPNAINIIYKYDEEAKGMKPYLCEKAEKTIYFDDICKNEYEYMEISVEEIETEEIETEEIETDPWWIRWWTAITKFIKGLKL
ncbi:hypothetical protein [Bacteroides sp. 519]|uniref:hypothetical protein n=1 Tax=Bacteroides sp. 519 TaxID=2302937 RepID=UPI0013D4492D|nr:hypothetical protein [Bacteroides sp. 519]NDV56564.1 hypothetical protein [Bacteroides sp. 519]